MTSSMANVGGTGAGGTSSPLLLAVAVSASLHVALLAGLPDPWTYSPTPATAPLNARLERAAPAAGTPLAEPLAPPAATRAAPRPVPTPQRAAPRAAPAAVPVPPAAAAAIAPDPRPREPVEQVVAAPTAAGAASGTGEPTTAPRPGDQALDLGSLAQFRLALIGTAKRYRLYPESAVERGWHGRVTVRIEFDGHGAVAAAIVRRSSGHAALDAQALDMLRRAAALTPVPPALRRHAFSVDVPVVFELRGEG
jgi:protein TonB